MRHYYSFSAGAANRFAFSFVRLAAGTGTSFGELNVFFCNKLAAAIIVASESMGIVGRDPALRVLTSVDHTEYYFPHKGQQRLPVLCYPRTNLR